MKINTLLLASLASLGLIACGDDVNKTVFDAKPPTDANTTPDAFVQPAAPTLGAQIDRMGRPAINTALNHAFDPSNTSKQVAKDAYNAAANPATWATTTLGTANDTVAAQFIASIGLIDSLDGCTTHPPFYPATTPSSAAEAYGTLAGALANDALLLDSSIGNCASGADGALGYLAVEAKLAGTNLMLCGGRAPTHDVIDASYSALAAGVNAAIGRTITDGVSKKGDGAGNNDTFPFLADPAP